MNKRTCLKCGDLSPANNPFPWIPGGEAHAHRPGCPGGRVIPIATICNPPEPTVIEASDLAPGMVVVAVDDTTYDHAWLCDPQTWMTEDGGSCSDRFVRLDSATIEHVRRVAGEPC